MSERPGAGERAIARIVLATPLPQLDRVFEYRIPERLRGQIGPGMRVRVPVRSARRMLDGFVVGTSERAEFTGQLAELGELVSSAPVLSPALLRLAQRVAERQAGQLADVLRLAIPGRHVGAEQRWLAGEQPRAAAAADTSAAHGAARRLAEDFGAEAARLLCEAGGERIALRPRPGVAEGVPLALTTLASIAAARFAAGQDVIIAVPDFRDVELLHAALRSLVPHTAIRRLDGRAKPAERYGDFLAGLPQPSGQLPPPAITIGTRAVIYAPAERLGCLIMWDDADDSYAEPHAPYAHARDVALLRHELEGATIVLAAHAPSLACARLAELGWLRVVEAPPPRTVVIPSDAVAGQEDPAQLARIPSIAWRIASEALDRGPVLVQVARAGYAPALACERCREPARCGQCHGPLRLTGRGAVPACALCGRQVPGWRCGQCEHDGLRARALGAGRTAEDLGRAFPNVRVMIADGRSESVSIDDAPALVIATRGAEPVPRSGYAAVLLLDGERMLAREALDAADETLRGWSNAVALLNPRDPGARAVLAGGAGPAGEALRHWRQPAAAAGELRERRALDFPPAVRIATVTGTSREEVQRAVDAVRGLDGVRVDGPVPAPEEREHSATATIRFPYRAGGELARALRAVVVRAATSRRGSVAGRPGQREVPLRIRMDPPHLF